MWLTAPTNQSINLSMWSEHSNELALMYASVGSRNWWELFPTHRGHNIKCEWFREPSHPWGVPEGGVYAPVLILASWLFRDVIFDGPADSPSKSSLMSLAAWMPSSFRFFSICLERAREALSSADMAHPILLTRRAATFEAQAVATPATHTHTLTRTHTRTSACGGMGNETWARADEWGEGGGKLCSDLYQAHTSLRNKSFIVPFPPCRIARSASGYHHHILSEFHSQSGLKQVPHDTELWLFFPIPKHFYPESTDKNQSFCGKLPVGTSWLRFAATSLPSLLSLPDVATGRIFREL